MLKIANFLFVKLKSRTFDKKYDQFIINTSNKKSNEVLINYLNTYPLISYKYLDFKDGEKANEIYTHK